MRTTLVGLTLALAFLAACGGGDATGPSAVLNVSGGWLLSISNMTDGTISCSGTPATMTLAQNGTTFSGSYGAFTLTCTGGGQTLSGQIQGGSVIDGSVVGLQVSFDLGTSDLHHSGTLAASSMSGSARYVLTSTTLNGTWFAARQ